MFPPPKPRVGFYSVHPREGISTYYSLSTSWPGTQKPLRVIATIHRAGDACAAQAAGDTGIPLASAWLTRADHHVVWRDWKPTGSGAFTVCTWLGNPVIATGATPVFIEPTSRGVTPDGSLVDAATSKTPMGPARAVFPTPPRYVYARFAIRGLKPGRTVTIEFRDGHGRLKRTHRVATGPALAWYTTRLRLANRPALWLVRVRAGNSMLGRIRFFVSHART